MTSTSFKIWPRQSDRTKLSKCSDRGQPITTPTSVSTCPGLGQAGANGRWADYREEVRCRIDGSSKRSSYHYCTLYLARHRKPPYECMVTTFRVYYRLTAFPPLNTFQVHALQSSLAMHDRKNVYLSSMFIPGIPYFDSS